MTKQLQKEVIRSRLEEHSYISDAAVTMSLFLALQLDKPLLIEGPAGVGKTEIAKVLAKLLDTQPIRLQCYEGIDVSQAIYEWNYQHQLMFLKLREKVSGRAESVDEEKLYSEKFLLRRPILQSISTEKQSVLLIDEIDRSDEAFESYLLEVLSDWQVTIPEIGTIHARTKPAVVLTSNSTRELSDALRRRCMYLHIDYPEYEKELSIIKAKVPDIDEQLVRQICAFMKELRDQDLRKTPGVAESLDWARSLAAMHIRDLDRELVSSTLGLVLKDWRDQRDVGLSLSELLEKTGVKSNL